MAEYINREEAIKELREVYEQEYPTASGDFDEYASHDVPNVLRNIKAADLQPVNQWVSVKDRLPEIGKSVLVIVSINAKVNLPLCTDLALEMRIGWLDDNGKWGLQFDSADRDEILYWMSLPEPPQDEISLL